MKTSAITRIVIYSLVIVLLLGILLCFLGIDALMMRGSSATQTGTNEGYVNAKAVTDLNIDWAAGSITIVTGNTAEIHIQETGEISEKYTMEYEVDGEELEISYAHGPVAFGVGSVPQKDLVITVPENWTCRELEIDGAALEVNIKGMTVDKVKCDGAAVELFVDVYSNCPVPSQIDVDGAGCEVNISMPSVFGYHAQMDGLGCQFNSNAAYTSSAGSYSYGNKDCMIYIDGVGCELTIDMKK